MGRKKTGDIDLSGALMSAPDVRLLQTSYQELWRLRDEAAARFYDRLFEQAPDTRELFRGDAEVQRRQFMAAVGHIVTEIEKPEVVLPAVKASALRHVKYGVLPRHYEHVGEAIVWTVGQIIGQRFVPIWENAYAKISRIMLDEAYPAKADLHEADDGSSDRSARDPDDVT